MCIYRFIYIKIHILLNICKVYRGNTSMGLASSARSPGHGRCRSTGQASCTSSIRVYAIYDMGIELCSIHAHTIYYNTAVYSVAA